MNMRYQSARKGKKVGVLLLAMVMFLTSIIPLIGLAAEDSPYPFVSSTNTDKVHMRRRASSTSTILERIALKGTPVTVLGDTGNYYKVSYNDRTGYIVKDYIGDGNPIKEGGTAVSDYPYNTSTKEKVKLRARTSTSSVVLAYIDKGETITVKGKAGNFVKADYNGTTGYVMSEFVNLLFVEEEAETLVDQLEDKAEYRYALLNKGSEGAEVRALQNALVELGFLAAKEVDGIFFFFSQKAVQALQKRNDLKATGEADQALQTLLYENKPKNNKGKAAKVMTLPPVVGATMRLNNTGEAVASLQQRLTELMYDVGEVSGVYNKKTIAAVKKFQQKNGVTVDGLAGYETQMLLYSLQAIPADAQAAPAPTALPQAPKTIIRQGDTGEDVEKVQYRLVELGYYQGLVDGTFGATSVAALQHFQQMNYLQADGIAGKETLKILFSADAVAITPPEATQPPVTQENVVIIQSGTAGEIVANLQKRLTELGYYTARNDGRYLADDIAAVRSFQRNNGLQVDGKAGYETQVRLYSAEAVAAFTSQTDIETPGAENTVYATLRQGDTGEQVQSLQNRLIELGYLAQGQADGRYGLKTAEAVVAFQKASGLVRDGVAGSNTLIKLFDTSATILPQATAAPTPGPNYLAQGDSNDTVKNMQQQLIDLGYLTGRADGIFGMQTVIALKAFQLRNGLSVDGIAGSKTLGMLTNGGKPAQGVVIEPQASPTPNVTDGLQIIGTPKAAQVIYANWYSTIRAKVRTYPMLTVYDFATGLSWRANAFSNGAHADAETLTAQDTANMLQAFGGKQTWTPKPVWVVLSDGTVFLASTHSTGHDVDHTPGNNISGHICIHFPRTQSQVKAIGSYATSHQYTIDEGWAATQNMIK